MNHSESIYQEFSLIKNEIWMFEEDQISSDCKQ